MQPFPGFIGSAYSPQAQALDCQQLINLYVERAEAKDAKAPQCLLSAPGMSGFVTLPTSPVRGIFAQNNRTFAVGGALLYEIARDGTITARAMTTLGTPSAPTVAPSPLPDPLPAPSTPRITHGGTLGTTTYGYRVTAKNALGETEGSTEGTSVYGFATLSATNYNVVTWDRVDDATEYRVWRTTGPSSGQLIAVVTAANVVVLDIGQTGDTVAVPSSNTSGGVAGSTTYGYKVTATLGTGETAASGEGTTITGQAELSATDYNIVTWPAVPNAGGYKVYRTTGPDAGVLIATVAGSVVTVNDVGADGEAATAPSSNTTGVASIADDGTPVAICSSGDAGSQILIIGGGSAYCYDLEANTLAPVLAGATAGGYIGGYFVVLNAATSTLHVSDLLDGYQWDGLQIYQRLVAGDRWLSMAVTFNEIWLYGSQTTDVWAVTGNADTRFAPIPGVQVPQGINAPLSLTDAGGSLVWLGQDRKGAGVVYAAQGYSAQRISTHAVEHAIQGLAGLADAVAFSYQQEGHTFYVLTFPSDEKTWVFDLASGEWHQRGYWNADAMAFTAYRPWCHAFAFGGLGLGKHLVGDRSSGRIAALSLTTCTDIDGAVIRRVRQAPHLWSQGTRITHDELALDLDVGLGTATGQGVDPTVMLSWSDDGGRTFGAERWTSAGAQGTYRTRVRWTRLGLARDRVYRLVLTDPVPWRLVAAGLRLRGGRD